jgi:hypothetical protein
MNCIVVLAFSKRLYHHPPQILKPVQDDTVDDDTMRVCTDNSILYFNLKLAVSAFAISLLREIYTGRNDGMLQ